MNTDNRRSNTPSLPKYLAAAGITLLLMTPLAASADHERHEIVEVLAGAAVAYLIIDSLDDDDNRYYRRHVDHYSYDRHYKQRHHDRHFKRDHNVRHYKDRHHAKHKRQHRPHKRYGCKDSAHHRYYR